MISEWESETRDGCEVEHQKMSDSVSKTRERKVGCGVEDEMISELEIETREDGCGVGDDIGIAE
jgi:hypothetical protein